MSITYGFFNAVDGDRAYNADQMSSYFEGLVSDGVYENVGSALQVRAGDGLEVQVQTGRAIIDCKWIKNDATETIALAAAHVLLPRYTAIVIRLDRTNRQISIAAKDGTPASTPQKPAMTSDATVKELCLAYVYVAANAAQISQANIQDMRASALCGWVTGVVRQVDTSQLFVQWQTAYEEFYAEMQSWKSAQESAMEAWQGQMQTAYQQWFEALSNQLSVNTYIAKYSKTATTVSGEGIYLDMTGYVYDESDIIEVFINGLLATAGTDYTLNFDDITMSAGSEEESVVVGDPYIEHDLVSGNVVTVNVYKSKIGFYTLETSAGDVLVTNSDEEITI